MSIIDFIAVVSFGLTCFSIGYTLGKDNHSTTTNKICQKLFILQATVQPAACICFTFYRLPLNSYLALLKASYMLSSVLPEL